MTSDVNTLRRAFECISHFGIATAHVSISEAMIIYGYTDCSAVYLTIPCEGRFKCSIPMSHLVKILRNCQGQSLVRLQFLAESLRLQNEVAYTVNYVSCTPATFKFPVVKACGTYSVVLSTLQRFLKMSGDVVTMRRTHGVEMETSMQSMVTSRVTFPSSEDPLMVQLGVPLPPTHPWPDEVRYSNSLLKYLCRTSTFQSYGKLVICAQHLVFQSFNDDVMLQVCFSSI